MDINQLLKELKLLEKENKYLKQLLSNIMHQREKHEETKERIITSKSLPQEKIVLFKTLFKGRSDVFAYRWISKDGKKGYTPACELEWQKPICQKPLIKCSECQHRKLTPLTDQVCLNI